MRVGGRIRKANLPRTLKNPVILPKASHISSLIISQVHEKTHHSGRGITLNELRSCGYWIVSGNAMVRQFISKCVTCRHLRGSQREQKMADLRKSSIEPAPPFTYCGVDFFGPWRVQRGRSVVKRVQGWRRGCRDGALVRALASHQCGPGSIPRSGVICGLSLLVLSSAPKGFLWVLRFPLSSKTKI